MMKKLSPVFLILFLAFVSHISLMAQPTPVEPLQGVPLPEWLIGGGGTTNKTYVVSTLANLWWIAAPDSMYPELNRPSMSNRLHRFYYQTADINALETQEWFPDGSGGYKGFIPIGGAGFEIWYYDGRGNAIYNLYINRPEMDSVGLFGGVQNGFYGEIMNLSLGNVNITGRDYVGGLIGRAIHGSPINCLTEGSVSGRNHVGGLVGKMEEGGSVISSYSIASVNGNMNVGGLVGWYESGHIVDSYAAGRVTGTSQVGGLIGYSSGTTDIENCFWDTQTSGQSTSAGGIGKTTDLMKLKATFTDAGWYFETSTFYKWEILDGNNLISYPYLYGNQPIYPNYTNLNPFDYYGGDNRPENFPLNIYPGRAYLIPNGDGSVANPFQIATLENLHWLSTAYDEWDKNFIQTANIEASATNTWNDGGGFWAIGDIDHKSFTGNYDGDGHTILSLTCNHPLWANTGLFGIVDGSEIKDLTLSGCSIEGSTYTGVLVGKVSNATISNVAVSGVVTGNILTGGLLGDASGCTISGCSSSANVTGNVDYTGGLIGSSVANDISTSNCTATSVSGISHNIGGFIGKNENCQIINCYSTADVVGGADNVGGFIGSNLGASAEISKCYATGNVSATVNNTSDDNDIGGFIGETEGLIENCYSRGNISTNGDGTPEVGVFISEVLSGANVQYCYTAGNYTTIVGDFGFIHTNNGTAVQNFYDSNLSSQNSGNGATAKPTAEMKTQATFITWDFTDIWAISSYFNHGYPNLNHEYEYLWDGSESEDWNTAGNWSVGSVPTIINDIKIPADAIHDIIIYSSVSASCNNLTIENGASLTIESNETGTGSLIINGTLSNSGTITSQRYFSGPNLQNWHMLSSPMTSTDISESNFVPTNDDDFYAWQETSPGTWVNYKNTSVAPTFNTVNGNDNFVSGKGYLVAYNEANPEKTFTGTLNTGNQTFTLKNNLSKDWTFNSGWNLMGNPYSSAIDWHLADKSLFLDDFAYAYNAQAKEGAGAYVPIDGSSENAYIAANQGFFVITKSSTANNSVFTFTNAMQNHGGTYFKNTAENDKLVLRFSGDVYYDETTIRQSDESTFNKDRVDAFKMNSFNAEAPNVYSISNDNINLSINSIPIIGTEHNIRIGIVAPIKGLYKIKVVEASNYIMNNNIYMEDLLLNKWHKISESEYSFTTDEGDIADRFVVHFGVVGLEELASSEELLYIWTNNSTINMYNPQKTSGELKVFNIMGQIVMQTKLNANTNQQIDLLVPNGYYIVNITTTEQIINKKVFLK